MTYQEESQKLHSILEKLNRPLEKKEGPGFSANILTLPLNILLVFFSSDDPLGVCVESLDTGEARDLCLNEGTPSERVVAYGGDMKFIRELLSDFISEVIFVGEGESSQLLCESENDTGELIFAFKNQGRDLKSISFTPTEGLNFFAF